MQWLYFFAIILLMVKERDYLFDNIKGLLIISVVLAHYFRVSGYFDVGSVPRVIYVISFSYIMQGFIFISGYFSKNVDKCRAGAFKNFIIPYVLFCILVFAERYMLYGNAHLNFLNPSFALWFLLVIFVYRFLIKDIAKIPHILPIALALNIVAGLVPFLGQDYSLGRLVSFFLFYIAGFACTGETIEKIRKIPKPIALVCLVLLIGMCIYCGSVKLNMEIFLMRMPIYEYGSSVCEYLVLRIVLLIMSFGWILVFINLMPRRKISLTAIGQHTMTVYLLHIFVRNILKCYHVPFENTIWYYIIIIGLAASSIYLFSKPAVDRVYNKVIDGLYMPFDKLINWRKSNG